MNFLLHCVLARQGHSDRVALGCEKIQFVLIIPAKFSFSLISVEPVFPTLLRGLSQCSRLSYFLLGPSCSPCIQKNPFSCTPLCSVSSEYRALLFSKFLSTQSKRSKEATIVLPLGKKTPNLPCINMWFPQRTPEVLTVSLCHQGRG